MDNGSCTYDPPPPVPGCTDPAANNFNPLATVDNGSCTYDPPPPIHGCTNPQATNYNPVATQDDGSCTFPPCTPSPAMHQFDTRISNTKITHDYLWAIERGFAFNFFTNPYFMQFSNYTSSSVGVLPVNSRANFILYAYRPGSPWHTRWNNLVVPIGGVLTTPANPEPTFYTNNHWTYLYEIKWRQVNEVPYYGIERYATTPVVTDTASYISIFPRRPMTGLNLGSLAIHPNVSSIATLTAAYNSTIHYKLQFTLEETLENTYMYYFLETRYLPASIQTVTTGADLDYLFRLWTATDLSDFKAWALDHATVPNKYFTGPEIICPPPLPNPPSTALQYTPNFTETASATEFDMIMSSTAISQSTPKVFSQDPDGIGYILPTQWDEAIWDGLPYDPTGKTKEEICAWLKPTENPNIIRGIREKFYEVNPFADNTNPTPAEIESWTFDVIRHFRAMFGGGNPVGPDARLYLETRWADERTHTIYWDTEYPFDPPGGSYGPCHTTAGASVDTASGHCGASFFPDQTDRTPYIAEPPYNSDFVKYPELNGDGPGALIPVLTTTGYTARRSAAEGISGVKPEIPWSLKVAVILAGWICTEGPGGHASSYLPPGRQKMGFSWWLVDPTWMTFRGKYAE